MINPSARKASLTWTAAALSIALVACSTDAPTSAPSFAAPDAALAVTALVDQIVVASLRTKPLVSDVTISVVIGSEGGMIKVDAAGFEIRVPKGAVSVKTTFQVKALAGAIVAYEFQPHGTKFAVPLIFSQSTKAIVGGSAGIAPKLGYFSSREQLNQQTGTASVSELSPASEITDISGKKIEGKIYHFSGYLVSSGRTSTASR